mgnify:CR=1 FL=1
MIKIRESYWYNWSKLYTEQCGQNFSLNAVLSLALLATIIVATVIVNL